MKKCLFTSDTPKTEITEESAEAEEPMETSAAEISVEDTSEQAKNDSAAAMDVSELDASKENSLSVSLFVHADDVQDDLDDDLKEAAAAEAAAKEAAAADAAAKSQEKGEEKSDKGAKSCLFKMCCFISCDFVN